MTLHNFNVYFFLTALCIVTIAGFAIIKPFWEPIFFAILLATVFYTPYQKLLERVKRPALAASLMLVVVAITIVVPVIGIATIVFNEVSSLVLESTQDGAGLQRSVALIADRITSVQFIEKSLTFADVRLSPDVIIAQIKQFVSKLWPYVQAMYAGAVNSTINFVVMFFTLFFLFIDGKRWLARIMHLSPLRDVYERQLVRDFSSMARATLKGTLIIGVIQGVLGGIAFTIAGIFSPMLWMLVMIVLSIIPAVGSGFIIFPAAVIMLLIGNIWQGIFLLCMGFIITSIDNVLRPKLVGKDTQMPTLVIFFATLGGLSVFGFSGFILGPIIMALVIALWNIYDQEFRDQLSEFNV